MTFETALERAEGYLTSCFSTEEYKEVEEIIKALKGEHSEDAISRKAVNELQRYRYNCGDTTITCVSLDSINKLPPVSSQTRKGRWIEERNDYGEITHWHCSHCYDDSGFITTCKWDFCPNCGAKMTESEVEA